MKLIDNARQVWHRLWSVRFALAAAAASSAQMAVDMIQNQRPSGAVVSAALLSFGAAVARLVQQPALPAAEPPKDQP